MDRERFDALARLLATTGSRRTALGALIGAGAIGAGLEAEARKRNGKSRGGGGKDKAKGKDKSRKRGNRAQSEARCCSTNNCTPGKGKNLGKCCYEGANLAGKNFSGANLGQANLSDADATGANFSGANLGQACLVDADLTNATINGSTNLGGAIFCRTTMPNGDENNSGCFKGTNCCPTCEEDAECGDGAICCNGNCRLGDCCSSEDCGPDEPQCINNTCSACSADGQCAGDEVCCDPICTDIDIDESNCGACGRECPDGATCRGGECLLVVSPGNLRGWRFFNDQADQPIPPQFEAGPGNPPRGNGSAFLTVAGNPEGELLAANIFVGTPLADFETLEYTFWVSAATSNTGPSLQLGIDFDANDGNNATFQGRMVYVPDATGPVAQNQWITIDVTADNGTGNWFFTRQAAPPAGSGGRCPQSNPCNFSEILGFFPDIRIFPVGAFGPGAGLGFIGFKVGSGEGTVDANIDSVRIKLEGADEPTVVYDFEANP